MNLDELIAELEKLKGEHGGKIAVRIDDADTGLLLNIFSIEYYPENREHPERIEIAGEYEVTE